MAGPVRAHRAVREGNPRAERARAARVEVQGEAAMLESYVRVFDITGKSMRNWVAVEPEGVEDDEQLKEWVERAMKFVKTLPSK